jgi:magnesium-transporting ATPase (P-type)
MYDIFNFNRFYHSILRLTSEKGIKMLGSILIMLFLFILIMNIELSPGIYKELQIIFLVLGLSFGPVFYMSVAANEMTSNAKGTAYLLLPNSIFEKWFLNSIVALLIYFVIFCSLYYLLDLLMIEVMTAKLNLPAGVVSPIEFFNHNTYIGFMAGTAISQGVILGSLYFNKNNLVYSLMCMFGLLIFIFLINHFSANLFFDAFIDIGYSAPYTSVFIENDTSLSGGFGIENQMSKAEITSLIFVPFIIAFSGIYFLRLKEKEL